MPNKIQNKYEWYAHPEGLKFVETHRDEFRTSGHWLMLPNTFSAFHRVTNNEELWYIHQGAITLYIIDEAGRLTVRKLGSDIGAGEEPVVSVPIHCWQAALIECGVPFAFGSVVCAPAFQFELFEIADRKELLARYPDHAEIITKLTFP